MIEVHRKDDRQIIISASGITPGHIGHLSMRTEDIPVLIEALTTPTEYEAMLADLRQQLIVTATDSYRNGYNEGIRIGRGDRES
jgi:hypothetical protein